MGRGAVGRLGDVRMASRQVEHVAGFQHEVKDRLAQIVARRAWRRVGAADRVAARLGGRPDDPPLGTVELHDEDVVVVEVDVEPLRRRRRQVGVDLYGLVELECEVVRELSETGVGEMQSLEHHGGAVAVPAHDAVRRYKVR